MNKRTYLQKISPIFTTLLGCVVLVLSACAVDRSAVHDLDRERYAALESEIISANESEERRRAAEYKIAQKFQQIETERAAAALDRQQVQSEILLAKNSNSAAADETATSNRVLSSAPLVTQISIGQSYSADSQSWRLQDYPSPIDGSPLCAVVSNPITVRNGTLDSSVTIIVGKTIVFLRTDTTFDPDTVETGFIIDAGFPIAFDRFINELTAVVDDGYERLVSAMRSGSTLSVAFGYSPQLSTANTHVIELGLDSFEQPLTELAECKN